MGELFVAAAFALGFTALLNPCSFALLPSYLGLFLNLEETNTKGDTIATLNRAQLVSLMMSLGILTVFLPVGLVFTGLTGAIDPVVPWINMAMGAGLFFLGIKMLRGYQLVLKVPKLNTDTTDLTLPGMYLFGLSYAIAALGCSAPIISILIGISTTENTFGSFASFSIGMAIALTTVTLAVAFGKNRVVNSLRTVMKHMNRISAVILVIAGAYLAYYGWWELDEVNNPEGPVGYVLDGQTAISNWMIQEVSLFGIFPEAERSLVLGLLFLALNLALIVAGFVNRKVKGPQNDASESTEIVV